MPGTDIDTATNKVITAVTSTIPQVKLEPVEKLATERMTQSPEYEDESLRKNAPSKMDGNGVNATCKVSPGAQCSDRDAKVTSSPANSPSADVVVFKSTKSASCGSLTADFRKEDDLASKIRRVSADAVDYSIVKTEPNTDFQVENLQRTPSDGNAASKHKDMETTPVDNLDPTRPSQIGSLNKNAGGNYRQNSEEARKGAAAILQSERVPYQHLPATLTPMMLPERKHECETCGVSFRSKKTYMVHVKHYCSGKRHEAECKICGAKFDSKRRLSIHMADHSSQYLCLICNERMSRPEECTSHMVLHVNASENEREKDGAETMACPGCELRFGKKMDLTGHVCTHHVTTQSFMPFQYATLPSSMQQSASPSSPPSEGSGRNGAENGTRIIREHSPVTSHIEDVEINNMSPPLTTSTPSRPVTTIRDSDDGAQQPFSCIVCSLGFPDVVELQRHLLTSHASGQAKAASPTPPISRPPQRHTNRQNCRKFSTVSPPQLSMLSNPMLRKISEPQRRMPAETRPDSAERTERSPTYSPMQTRESPEDGDASSKKRKERNGGNADFQNETGNSLKRAKRDGSNHASLVAENALGPDKYEQRRISCPVVSSKLIENDKGLMPPGCFIPPPVEERYCVQCDIAFSNAANFRAHKKYYCASRHMHKNQDEGLSDFVPVRHPKSDSPDAMSSGKLRKRNVGNRSSVTSRKRSHLTPLETVRDISPVRDPSNNTLKVPSIRKSCPSGIPTSPTEDGASRQPSPRSQNPSPNAPPVLTKKHLCQECNIMFSKYDTYVAHKKFYCESRRKDRGGQRQPPAKMPMKRKSESNLRDPLSMVDNPLFTGDHRRMWSPQRNSPSTDGDEDRQLQTEDGDSITKDQQNRAFFKNGTLPFGPYTMDQEMLARMSFMHPLIINQYLTLIRERMAQGLCGNGFLVPPMPVMNIPGTTGSPSPAMGLHKRSMSETKAPMLLAEKTTSPHMRSPGVSPAPRTGSVEAPVKIKQEPTGEPSAPHVEAPVSRLRSSPLDLSNKSLAQCTTPETERKTSQASFPYPTIDLRTTALAVVKKEPKSDFPMSGQGNVPVKITIKQSVENERVSPAVARADSQPNDNINFNNNVESPNSTAETRPPAVAGSPTQHEGAPSQPKPRAQHCKNCDTRFTSLSTFIAHKKYYCSASNSNNILCSDAKAAQMAR